MPMRVDVFVDDSAAGSSGKESGLKKRIGVWQTFRANEWDNKGEVLGEASAEEGLVVNVQVLGGRDVYEKRGGCESIFFFPRIWVFWDGGMC